MIWDENELQRLIDDEVEESLVPDYKAAGSLDKNNDKKTEITKDVSAMANSAGGTVIFGIREFPGPKNHLPERIEPIERSKFSKEWLEQIINNIRPRIDGVIVHPVSLSSDVDHAAYVVEIPKSTTVHQALDHRYYKRFNFQSVPMEDHEIRDVMNRRGTPDAEIRFAFRPSKSVMRQKYYILLPVVKNSGKQVIEHFRLIVTFPRLIAQASSILHSSPNIDISFNPSKDFLIHYQSTGPISPGEERNVGEQLQWEYGGISSELVAQLESLERAGKEIVMEWTLYADDMPPKHGKIPAKNLHDVI